MSYVLGILPQDVNKVKVAQSCPTLCDTMVFTVHGILQAGIGEWVAFPFSRGSSQLREQTQVFHIACRFFTNWAIREALRMWISTPLKSHREILHPPFGLSWCLLLNVHFKNLWEFLKKKKHYLTLMPKVIFNLIWTWIAYALILWTPTGIL